jgi:adenine-specific DNA methylase
MPKTFDPFAGGGAIPLEAARLGCTSFGNDLNPAAHIIQKASVEFPQKFGKPIIYSLKEFVNRYGKNSLNDITNNSKVYKDGELVAINIQNRLSFDFEFYAKKVLNKAEEELGKFYPLNKDHEKSLIFYWVRVGQCSNRSCKAEVPMLKQFYLSKRRGTDQSEWTYLNPKIKGTIISFEILNGSYSFEGWVNNHSIICPCCGNTTTKSELKIQANNNTLKEKLIAVLDIIDGKQKFRLPTNKECSILNDLPNVEIPPEDIVKGDSRNLSITLWGIDKWGKMFSKRQLLLITTLVKINNLIINNEVLGFDTEYYKAIKVYIALLIDRIALRNTRHNTWHVQQNTVETIMGRQTLSMILDYPEMNPFSSFTSSVYNLSSQISDYIISESHNFNYSSCQNASSGDINQFENKYIDAVVTDPPYYDAIAYADLSDFFYVWLKRNLSSIYPLNFATPLTPKAEECTALKHHHNNDKDQAQSHFETKLTQIFKVIEYQTKGIVSIMFAHQSTEAWTTLCNSILDSKMNITGSWAIDTEFTAGLKEGKAFLSSSVTVCAKPAQRIGIGDYKEVKKAIEKTVEIEVRELYSLGLRGADLLTACFGQAVSEFGKYEKVEKADGSEVTVADLLEMARESAFNALLKGFDGDDFTKFYIGWLQLYSFTESDFDDAAKFSRVGLSINVQELFTEHILIKNGNKQTLGGFQERLAANKKLGERANNFLIDIVHKAMALYKGTNRNALLQFISKVASSPESSFWRVVTSLCEVLPAGSEDHKQATGLLINKDSLIRESKTAITPQAEQTKLFE